MQYGIVTHVQSGIGVIHSKGLQYKFSLSDFPNAVTGMGVMFDPANPYHTEKLWVNKIEFDRTDPSAAVLQRLEKIENHLLEIKKQYELPEAFFAEHCGAEDESA